MERIMGSANSFGRYLRRHRVAARLSLREAAAALGVSHVYLGEVERGVRPPLQRKWWPRLIQVIPSITERELVRESARKRPLQMDLSEAPAHYQELALSLARRIESKDLESDEVDEIMRVLKGRPK
jgi:transcriptional regulator with XRE-family HTH domain